MFREVGTSKTAEKVNHHKISLRLPHSQICGIVATTPRTKTFFSTMVLCLGPTGAGKTLLLKKLQNVENVDETATSVPTVGTNMFTIRQENDVYEIRELGGVMSPLWSKYFTGMQKVIYVVDASNLCQISAAGVLLYTIIANPMLANAKFLLVLTKMDVSYRQMRNEALLMLQMRRFEKEIKQKITITEASAITGEGREEILNWLKKK